MPDSPKLQVLLKEYEAVTKEIHGRIEDIMKIITIGVTVLGVGLSVGLSQNQHEILLILPLAYFGVLLFYVYTVRNLFLLGGYKQLLSDKINLTVEEKILVWESISKEEVHFNVNRIFLELVYLMTGVLTVWASIDTAMRYFDCRWVVIVVGGNVILLIGLLLSIYQAARAYKRSYELGKNNSAHDERPKK